jgi:branched-subunit amino acid transport protein AzlD
LLRKNVKIRLHRRLGETGRFKWYLIYALVDETFALISSLPKELEPALDRNLLMVFIAALVSVLAVIVLPPPFTLPGSLLTSIILARRAALPVLCAATLSLLAQLWKGSFLLSILGGTALYMLLTRLA